MSKKSLYHPRHWPSWLAIFFLRLIAALPFKGKLLVGKAIGLLAYRLIKKRRHVTETNIRLCYPELNSQQQQALVRDIFIQNSIGFFEIAWAWWLKPEDIAGRYTFEGLEHIEAAKAGGKGIVLVGAHLVHLDLAGFIINQITPIGAIYRKNNNAVLEHVITKGRQRVFSAVLERSNMRQIVRELRAGQVLWYAPDQDFGRRQSVFVPFFGVPASTLTTTAQLARMGRANVCFVFHYRDPVTHPHPPCPRQLHELLTGVDAQGRELASRVFDGSVPLWVGWAADLVAYLIVLLIFATSLVRMAWLGLGLRSG